MANAKKKPATQAEVDAAMTAWVNDASIKWLRRQGTTQAVDLGWGIRHDPLAVAALMRYKLLKISEWKSAHPEFAELFRRLPIAEITHEENEIMATIPNPQPSQQVAERRTLKHDYLETPYGEFREGSIAAETYRLLSLPVEQALTVDQMADVVIALPQHSGRDRDSVKITINAQILRFRDPKFRGPNWKFPAMPVGRDTDGRVNTNIQGYVGGRGAGLTSVEKEAAAKAKADAKAARATARQQKLDAKTAAQAAADVARLTAKSAADAARTEALNKAIAARDAARLAAEKARNEALAAVAKADTAQKAVEAQKMPAAQIVGKAGPAKTTGTGKRV